MEVETASQHKDKSPASGREVSSIPDIPNTKGTEPETSARLAVSEIPSEDRRSDALFYPSTKVVSGRDLHFVLKVVNPTSQFSMRCCYPFDDPTSDVTPTSPSQ